MSAYSQTMTEVTKDNCTMCLIVLLISFGYKLAFSIVSENIHTSHTPKEGKQPFQFFRIQGR